MMEFRLVQGSLLKKVIESIKDLVTDATFDCTSTGFSLQAMDSSHVALVVLLLKAECFEHYRCDRNISMGMNLNNLSAVLKGADNDAIIILRADDDDADTVTFMFEDPSIVKMPSAEFTKNCKYLSSFGDTVVISVTKEGVKFSTSGDMGAGDTRYKQSNTVDKPEEATIIEINETVSLAFGLRYMNSFTKASPLSNTVTISLSSELPGLVEYKIAEMGYIRFYLAPKMIEDDQRV